MLEWEIRLKDGKADFSLLFPSIPKREFTMGVSCSASLSKLEPERGNLMQSRGGNTSQLLCFSIQGDANIHVVVCMLPGAQPGNRGSIERRPIGEVLVVEDQGFTQQGSQVKLGHLEGHSFGCLLISTIRHCCPEKGTHYFIKNQNKRSRAFSVRCYSVLKMGSL